MNWLKQDFLNLRKAAHKVAKIKICQCKILKVAQIATNCYIWQHG